MPLALHRLNLTRFRNYDALRLDIGGAPLVALSGANGAGKTNILEAISFLTPGRGLRHADLSELGKKDAGSGWAVAAEIENSAGRRLKIGTGMQENGLRRTVLIDGKEVKSQGDLSSAASAVWLTPQMDRLFLEGPSERRRFLDRLVFSFDPAHAGRLTRHDKNLRERMTLLQTETAPDPLWLDRIELQLAADAVAILAARKSLLLSMERHLSDEDDVFPRPLLSLSGRVHALLQEAPALAAEETVREELREARGSDAAAGKSSIGAHRSDFLVHYADKNISAAQCSTGEQKALLVSIVLAHARMIRAEKGAEPLLLLDEIAAHLDAARLQALFSRLGGFSAQVWMTGTEEEIFMPLKKTALRFRVSAGVINPTGYPVAV